MPANMPSGDVYSAYSFAMLCYICSYGKCATELIFLSVHGATCFLPRYDGRAHAYSGICVTCAATPDSYYS